LNKINWSNYDKIVWEFKLSPETVNLPARKNVPEIEIFTITLRESELHADILKCIDNAIPFPVIYELVFEGKIKTKAAFKRPSDADSNKWVTDIYFESKWQKNDTKREPFARCGRFGVYYTNNCYEA
jgi:hypothetical protein